MGDDFDDLIGTDSSDDVADLDIDMGEVASSLDLEVDVDAFTGLEGLEVGGHSEFDSESSGDDSGDADLEVAQYSEEEFNEVADSAVTTYSEDLVGGVSVSYSTEPDPEDPSSLGEYNTETGEIALQDHVEEAQATLHHELGHHITLTQPEFASQLGEALGREHFTSHHESFLALYPEVQRPAEAMAESFAQCALNPAAFQELYPDSAALIAATYRS